MKAAAGDFYDIQRRQKIRTGALLALLVLFYVVAIGLLGLAVMACAGALTAGGVFSRAALLRLVLFDVLAAVGIALYQFVDARKFGAAFILRRLQARPPDAADVYHRRFADALDEMRIAAGLRAVRGFVLPAFAVNSMALVEPDGTAAVAVTEGLLADFDRDEVGAVCAHELAHVARGDAVYVTLVCSLANVFEKIREALEPESADGEPLRRRHGESGPVPIPLYAAAALSGFVMRLLSALISRGREVAADAAAVEFTRNPEALARALSKARARNSFVGDFSPVYAPLFIVPPGLGSEEDRRVPRVFTTHPPVAERIASLAAMARKSPADIAADVARREGERRKARVVLGPAEEPGRHPLVADGKEPGPAGAPGAPATNDLWSLKTPDGAWTAPMPLVRLIAHPAFTTLAVVRGDREGITAKAREFPQVRAALRGHREGEDGDGNGRCPRCSVALNESFYEGVPVRTCPRCRGTLIEERMMDRVIARREVAFSEDLRRKAREFRERMALNPLKKIKRSPGGGAGPSCPACGSPMATRPYNYQYFVLVDRCFACGRTWFDGDELEILQALIERD